MESLPLNELHVQDPQVRDCLKDGKLDDARKLALARAATALADLGAVAAVHGDLAKGFTILQQGQQYWEDHQGLFHNLLVVLRTARLLRGGNLDRMQGILNQHRLSPWTKAYHWVFALPRFANVEFTKGKCNLKCRMCLGTQAAEHPDKLALMSVAEVEHLLNHLPSIDGLTVSAGDSDPLLHPDFEKIMDLLAQRQLKMDIFTNGHPLGEKLARAMVEKQAVQWLNVSIDAATAETYQRIRGADLARVQARIGQLQAIKKELDKPWPQVALAFVAMVDNIEELPAFVDMARELGAARVFVEDLIGWNAEEGTSDPRNRSLTENPRWEEATAQAVQRAQAAGLTLELPQRLQPVRAATQGLPPEQGTRGSLPYCGWVPGVWVNLDGSMDPCCMVHGVADMGNVKDGPVENQPKFQRVKQLLQEGKVFKQCASQRMCHYVQQQKARGVELRVIREEELGDCARKQDLAMPVLPG